jgi:hypothetical protein
MAFTAEQARNLSKNKETNKRLLEYIYNKIEFAATKIDCNYINFDKGKPLPKDIIHDLQSNGYTVEYSDSGLYPVHRCNKISW